MVERGRYTLSEILSQPTIWQATLDDFSGQMGALKRFISSVDYNQVIFTGCGSTYYLSIMGATLFQSLTGIPATARPASELVLFPDLVFVPNAKPLLICVSRSGTTSETIEAAQYFRSRTGGKILVVTCDPETPLANEADFVLAAIAAQEESVAQTRSFSSMAVLIEALSAFIAGRDDVSQLNGLVPACHRLITTYHELAKRLGESGLQRYFFLGSGWQYGIACEAMLKMKEMSLSYSEAYHALEFRHGPMSMVNDQTLMVGLLSSDAAQHESAVLNEMKQRGANILALVDEDSFGLSAWSDVVALKSNLPAWARPVLYLPVLQLTAYYRAMSNGQNPDRPANLVAVIKLEKLRS